MQKHRHRKLDVEGRKHYNTVLKHDSSEEFCTLKMSVEKGKVCLDKRDKNLMGRDPT